MFNIIDTVVLKSPYLCSSVALKIESTAFARMGVDLKSNIIQYQITVNELKGTFDSSIRVKIEWEEYKSLLQDNGSKITAKVSSEPYLIIECSLNKLFQGHNVFGGSDDFKQFDLLIKFLEKELDVPLPDYKEFYLTRLDYAEIFQLGEDQVYNYIRMLSNSSFSRRKSLRFGDTGLYFPGSTTTVKFYAKGKEFKKNDRKRLLNFINVKDVNIIQNIANSLLRVEVEIKSPKIKYDNDNKILKIGEYKNIDYFKNIYNIEVAKLVKIIGDENKYYIKYDDVKEKLYADHSSQLASNLLGTWLKLSLVGEDELKSSLSKTTFYRHRKLLIESRCDWNNNIVEKSENNIIDFKPINPSKYNYIKNNDMLHILYETYQVS